MSNIIEAFTNYVKMLYMSETGDGFRPTGTEIFYINTGQAFWNKLKPERQKVLEGPIREMEESIARYFPKGYKSPLVDKIDQLKSRDGLEKQKDGVSCTYHAVANALRILDEPRTEYSRDKLKNRIELITGEQKEEIKKNDIEKIIESGDPYNRFKIKNIGDLRLGMVVGEHPELTTAFKALSEGVTGVSRWYFSPEPNVPKRVGTASNPKIETHARTVVGFEKGSDDRLKIHIIDPYEARHEVWSFRDWYTAVHMDILGNEKVYSDEEIANFATRMKEKDTIASSSSLVANRIWLIEKRNKPIVIKKPTHNNGPIKVTRREHVPYRPIKITGR